MTRCSSAISFPSLGWRGLLPHLLPIVYLRPLLQDRVQQRTVNLYSAVVADEAQFSEFVHEGTDAGSRRADHLRQRPLIETCVDGLRAALLAEIGEQQKQTRKSLLAGIEELIDQIRFNPVVPS
jgi:hypothetical protein